MARDDCQEGRRDQDGNSFYESYLAMSKASGLSNWLKRVLKREGWSFRKNSVGQTVPDDWLEKAVDNAKRICERFCVAGVAETLGPGRGEGGCVRIVLEEEEEVDLETEAEAAEVKATGEEVEVVTTQATV